MHDGKFRVGLIKMSNNEPIPEDEPIHVFRARDWLAVKTLTYYLELSQADGCTDYQLNAVRAQIERFKAFARKHPERMKQPGVTKGL